MNPTFLDHVALYVSNRDMLADVFCDQLDVHIIDRTDRYTLLGPNAKAGKITLFDTADGQPEAGQLVSLTLAENERSHRDPLMIPEESLMLTFRAFEAAEQHALIGLTLRSSDPVAAAEAYVEQFGFDALSVHPNVATVAVAGGTITLTREDAPAVGQPVLNHLGLLVDTAQDHINEANEAGMKVLDIVDAPNTYAVFIEGPDGVSVEYVEHKPAFALS